jgi:RTX calcium-binding nonapeptide repeat (4 copies)
MAITPTGQIVDTIATDGDYWVSNTSDGTLVVDAASILSVTAPNAASSANEARFSVGRNIGITAVATVTGAGSIIDIVGNGRADSGAAAQIGRSGSNGTLHVNDGGLLRIQDLVGTASNGATGTGFESLNVGRDAGSTGTLEVSGAGSTVSMVGTGTNFSVGRDTGTGTATFTAGTALIMRETIAASNANITVGRGGGNGTMTFDGGTATLTGGGGPADAVANYGAFISVGRDAGSIGSLTLSNNGSMTFNGTSALLSTTAGNADGTFGRDGGTGTLLVQSGGDLSFNGGTEGATFNLGRNGSSAAVTTGTATITGAGSTLVVDSTGGNAFMGVGRGAGSTGTLNVANGGAVSLEGDVFSSISLGVRDFQVVTGLGGSGTINITDATSIMTVHNSSTANSAFFELGIYGGTGAINVNAGTMRFNGATGVSSNLGYVYNASASGHVTAGSGGGTASILVENGGRFEFIDGTGSSNLNIGRGASAATVTVRSGGHMDLDDDAIANSYVGVGSGLSTVQANLLVTGAGSILDGVGLLLVGQNTFDAIETGGNGVVTVAAGGLVSVDGGVSVGMGGRLQGHLGTVATNNGSYLGVSNGGNLGDAGGVNQTMTITGGLALSTGANVKLDVSAAGNDLYNITGTVPFGTAASLNVDYTVVAVTVNGGYQFADGEQRVFANVTNGVTYASRGQQVSVSGQHADFGYYFGQLSATSFGLKALTAGATGGTAVLDFGAASTLAGSVTAPNTTDLIAIGGVFLSGGVAENVDSVLGTAVADVFNIAGANHGMTLDGRAGADTLTGGSGNDTLIGGAGNDVLAGGSGNDTLDLSGDAARGGGNGVYVDLGGGATLDGFGTYDTLSSFERVIGTDSLYPGFAPYSDLIFGSSAANIIEGRGGNDYLEGFGGADVIYGETGNDILSGGEGADSLIFGTGNDYVFGGNGGDAFYIQAADVRAGDYDTVVDFVAGQDYFAVSASLSGQIGVYQASPGIVLMYANAAGGAWYQQVYGTGVTAAAVTAALFYI